MAGGCAHCKAADLSLFQKSEVLTFLMCWRIGAENQADYLEGGKRPHTLASQSKQKQNKQTDKKQRRAGVNFTCVFPLLRKEKCIAKTGPRVNEYIFE